jgi:hypothetical protein
MPSGNEARGTACSGIIVGRGTTYPGITGCSLVVVRIAKGDGHDGWIIDDFATADAIDCEGFQSPPRGGVRRVYATYSTNYWARSMIGRVLNQPR